MGLEQLRDRELALAGNARAKTRVYLDLKYWIHCRDAQDNRSTVAAQRAVSGLLRRLVRDDVVVCPVDEVVITEVLKHGNPGQRAKMAELLDEMSAGICLKPFFDRVACEVLVFLYRALLPHLSLHDRESLVWTKPAFLFGAFVPYSSELSNADNAHLAAAFDDHLWSLTASQCLKHFAADGDILREVRPDYRGLAARINAANTAHATSAVSRRDVYEAELRGAFDVFADIIWDALEHLHSRHPTSVPHPPNEPADRKERMAASLAGCFIAKKLWREFPTAHIQATLYGRVRRDRARRIQANDFEDFRHATAALPYCDAFLTERSLADLINAGDPSLASQFGVTVLADLDEAVAWLRSIAGPATPQLHGCKRA
jgi:hypothetical protein